MKNEKLKLKSLIEIRKYIIFVERAVWEAVISEEQKKSVKKRNNF